MSDEAISAKSPVSEFENLMAVTDAVLHVRIGDGPDFIVRPGADKDRTTPPDTMLWRYMPKAHFYDLLSRQALFFSRLTHHHAVDPFEGALPYAASKIHESIVEAKSGDVEEFIRAREVFMKKFLRVVLINCWHEREYENRSMWDRYGKGGEAVAVVSTFGRLRDSLPNAVDLGHVDYVDIGSDTIINNLANPSHRAFQKVRELDDEREVRGVVCDWPTHGFGSDGEIPIEAGTEIGYRVPANLERLVTKVVISPDSPQIIEEVRKQVGTASLTVDVVASSLSRKPTY